ncbi:hypothetical protein VCRA2117O376_30196 [Vibrio crassostreae]|nr:hypothetical protein VCRA2117O378_110091 [Vibrio crassostreae]CAK1737279.1 hypothetical protein VCRA2113O356_120081 [Vibrio crassostreae]CAK1986593.1 hypothetical protein VCRA2110O182_20193 [Vibrio crassostreae]CAK2063612.1 hypothetical protein VCRA2114O423_30165 [Vibrio crassostreae]CAK2071216.1 hypothetical protein VCRA2113O411_30165 [Vibrio crassostreae]
MEVKERETDEKLAERKQRNKYRSIDQHFDTLNRKLSFMDYLR